MKSLFGIAVAALLMTGCQKGANTAGNEIAETGPVANSAVADMTDMAAMDAMMMQMQGVPMAHDAAMQRMHERHEGMERIGKAFKTAGRTLKLDSPDIAATRAAAATIAQLALQTPSWFPAGTGPDVGKTGAKPEIWQKPADFVARDKAFRQAAAAFDKAAGSGDLNSIQARFGELGKTCKACHDSYRSEMHH